MDQRREFVRLALQEGANRRELVQAVSCLSADPAVVWAEAAHTPITAARIAAATRVVFVSNG